MSIHYSATLQGFFDPQIHTLPADAVPVSAKRHAQLLAAQEAGGQIVADADGKPVIASVPAEDLRAALLVRIKREAARRIRAISPEWRQLNDWREPTEEGSARFVAIDMVRAAGSMIEDLLAETAAKALPSFPVRDNPLWPQVNEGTE